MGPEGFSLEGKVAFVTGATGGIARTVAHRMAEAGAELVLGARRLDVLEEVAREVRTTGRKCLPLLLDVNSLGSLDEAVGKAVEEFASIDILVNAAGVLGGVVAEDVTEEEWDSMMNTNMKGLFFLSQAVGRVMISQGKGKIINFASGLALLARETRLTYTVSKAAVVTITRALALEWAKHNVNVNAIAPTFTETPMTAAMAADRGFVDAFVRRIPMGRPGTPEDLVGGCIYLASDASDFVTGHLLVVDGGWSLHQEPA
jgi:2-deoxy-D-gluconate 3-dehydrogenase